MSEVLRVLVQDFAGDFVFKGGTSLSKGYRIIERFSEDVDILALPGERGRGATDNLMKQMASAAAVGVDGEASAVGGSERGRHRAYAISYPATRDSTGLIRTSVLLEMGIRGGDHPREPVTIGCLLGDALEAAGADLREFDDLEPFEIAVLHPGRTLLEKLVLIHAAASELDADATLQPNSRNGRHFYDIYKLLGHDNVQGFLAESGEAERVLDNIAAITHEYFDGGCSDVRPQDGFAASPAFDPSSTVSAQLCETYEAAMGELYFGSGPLPTWDEICGRVGEMREML